MNRDDKSDVMSEMDNSITNVDWDRLTNNEKLTFANAMMAVEISFREKEKLKSIVASRFFTTFITMISLLTLMFFEFSESAMLITVLSIQMLALGYNQLLEFALSKIHERSKVSTRDILKNFEKKYPIEENKDLV